MKEDDLSLFGEEDVSDIPDDPWFIAQGTYLATVTESKRIVTKEGNPAMVINYTIDEPDSDFHGQTKSDYFALFPGRKFNELDPEEKKIRIRLKARLREGFDKTEEEIPRVKPEDLIGEVVYITIKENAGKNEHEGKTFSNISKVQSKRLHEEQNESRISSGMTDTGLAGM